MSQAKQSAASREGFQILSDADLLAGTENRARQLEAELAGNRMFLDEAEADPHDDASAENYRKAVESLEARLAVVYQRRDALKANIKADAKVDTSAKPPTT